MRRYPVPGHLTFEQYQYIQKILRNQETDEARLKKRNILIKWGILYILLIISILINVRLLK